MRVAIVTSAICLCIVGISAAADTDAAIKRPTYIPAERLDRALHTLAADRGLAMAYRSELVGDRQTRGASGDLTRDEALTQLLLGTGLTYRFLDEQTVTIVAAGVASAAQPANSAASQDGAKDSEEAQQSSFWDRFRLAEVDQGASTVQSSSPSNSLASGPGASPKNPTELEEIVVTARKREERLIDVPMSIVAIGADELQLRQVTTLEDLQSVVPGFALAKTGNNVHYEIRGVSNSIGTGPLVGLYIDEADMTLGGASSTQANPVAYDLERVEVLRGPQGTLYGEGSAGGTIRLITKNPGLTSLAFDAQVAAMFTEEGDPSQRINAMVNVPLIDNQLGVRIATTFEHDGGWIDLAGTDQQHINTQNLSNVRVKGLWKPASELTVSAMAIINRDDRSMDYSSIKSATQWTQSFNLPAKPRLRNDYDLYNLTATYDLPSSIRILNATTYLRLVAPMWNNGVDLIVIDPAAGLPPFQYLATHQKPSEHVWSDELRLTSTSPGPWQWTVGGFYRHYRDDVIIDPTYIGFAIPGAPLPDPLPPSGSDTLYKSWSAFGDSSYQLWERFTLGAGVRYFREHQDFANLGTLPPDTTLVATVRQTGDFNSTNPRVYAQFKPTPEVNIYASAAKGFRSGGFNTLPTVPTYKPESVWTYELGTKMSVFDGRVRLDSSLFWSDYTDYQTAGIPVGSNNPNSTFTNAGKARIKGVEWSLTWRPLPQWLFDVRGDYLNTKFIEVNTIPNPLTGLPSSPYVVGDQVDFAPRYQFSTSGEYDFVFAGKPGLIRLDYSQQGHETQRNRSIGPFFFGESDIIKLLNLRTTLQLHDNFTVGFSAQNLLNNQGFVDPFAFSNGGSRSRPRTYGVDFSASFN